MRSSKIEAVLAMMICLCALSGCRSMERITESEQMNTHPTPPPSAQDAMAPAEAATSENMAQGQEPAIEPNDPEHTLVIEDVAGEGAFQYTVEDWSIYESWEDAGISADRLASDFPGDKGVLLVTITKTCISRTDDTLTLKEMALNEFDLVSRTQIDRAQSEGSGEVGVWLSQMGILCYLDEPGEGNQYFFCPMLQAGQSMTYTLGYTLSDASRAAAEDGTLLLWYTTNGWPSSVDEMLLLPVN